MKPKTLRTQSQLMAKGLPGKMRLLSQVVGIITIINFY